MGQAINANAFSKCSPAISTNIKQCGSVTVCKAITPTSGDLASMYQDSSNEFRVMEALFHHDFEIKMCEAVQNGLYDFLMANKVNMRKQMSSRRMQGGLIEIAPFVMGRQYSPINNIYWNFIHGEASGDNWLIHAYSTTNIPALAESFPAGMRLFLDGVTDAGTSTKTQWEVVSATLSASAEYVVLVLSSQNGGSFLDADKLTSPTQGILRRGTPNVNDFEKFCAEQPTYLNWKNVPFWVETTRTSMCKSSRYDKYRELILGNSTFPGNALYKEFFYLDETEKNKQLAADWQRRLVDQMFWGKAISANQTLALYDNLETIAAYDAISGADTLTNGDDLGLGIDVTSPENCVGKRANAIGIYEQLAECSRVTDLQGGQLNLPALFTAIYNMMRVREGRNHPNPKSFDLFTDSVTAELFSQAMIKYYNGKSDGTFRTTAPVGGFAPAKEADFGFSYRVFPLNWPAGVKLNIITHNFFDDYISASLSAGMSNTGRVLWILDFTGIYPGILASNRVVAKTGDLKTLAAINRSFACVMAVDTQEQTLISLTWTMVVECPMGNLVLENFNGEEPEPLVPDGSVYDGGSDTTATTTTTHTDDQ